MKGARVAFRLLRRTLARIVASEESEVQSDRSAATHHNPKERAGYIKDSTGAVRQRASCAVRRIHGRTDGCAGFGIRHLCLSVRRGQRSSNTFFSGQTRIARDDINRDAAFIECDRQLGLRRNV